jgi:hypothetical protein
VPVPPALELPGREAPDVEVILVDPWVGAIVRELDLELQLVMSNRTDTGPRVESAVKQAKLGERAGEPGGNGPIPDHESSQR